MPTWIRVRDDRTGHEYDARPEQIRPGVTPIEGYPSNAGPAARPRPAKAFRAKDGRPAQPKRKRPAPPATETEN